MSNQRNGVSVKPVWQYYRGYASNIENLPKRFAGGRKIARSTASGIKPEQYSIVGTHLLATLDMFNPGGAGRVGQTWRTG